MIFFVVFLLICSSLTLFKLEYFPIGIILFLLALFLIITRYKNKKAIVFFIVIFTSFSLKNNISIQTPKNESYTGIILNKKNSYFIFYNGLEKFYINSYDNDLKTYDIVKIKGLIKEYYFTTLESDFDFNSYLKNQNINRQIVVEDIEVKYSFFINFDGYKEKVINRFSSESSKEFASAILFNEVYNSKEIKYKFKNLKMANLFALSGIFISIIFKFVEFLLSKFIDEKKYKWLSLLVVFPILLISITSFTTRRIIYFKVFQNVNNYKLKNKLSRLTLVSFIGIFVLFFNPYKIFSLSFYIPFLINFMFIFLNFAQLRIKTLKRKFYSKIFIFLIILPFTITFTNSFNIISYIVSILLIPIFTFIYIILFLAFYGIYFSFFDNIIDTFYNFFKRLNFKYFEINFPILNTFYICIYFVLLVLFFYFYEIRNRKTYRNVIKIFSVVLFLEIFPYNIFYSEVSFINVGQGDSTFISYKGENYLIDTGGLTYKDVASDVLIPYLRSKKIYKIDYVFITHNDFDHSGALNSLKTNFIIKNVIANDYDISILNTKLKFEDLNVYKTKFSDENDKSMVLKFKISNKTYLLMGDASRTIEEMILNDNIDIKIDYLKVGHHGSNSSSSEKFISYLDCKEAIISCGYNNKYKHPSDSVIDILNKYDISIRRTDIEGTISYKYWL